MEPKVIRIEIKVTRTMATVLAGLLVVLALLAVPSAGARPPLEGPGGQGGVTVASTVPTMISYQGQLLDSGGNLVPDGTYTMTFKLYNVASGGTAFWVETHPSVQVTDGLFNVLLGEYVSLRAIDPDGEIYPIDPLYLGVTVGGDPEMTPRQRMVSVPFAFRAGIAEQCVNADNDWDYTTNPPHMYSIPTGNVGIGTMNPQAQLDVACPADSKSYIRLDPNTWGGCNSVTIVMNEYRNRNKLWISAYDQVYGNLIYTEDPQEGSGQGFGIAGGSWMAPFDRFVVNTDEMFLGYSILPGDGEPAAGGDGTGNLYVRGNVGIGTTTPQNKLDVEGTVAIGTDYSGTATAPADGMIIEGNVGIGTTAPAEKLDVVGTAQMTGFKMPTGASNGYVLTSNASGVGTWKDAADGCWECPNAPGSGPVYTLLGKVGIGTTSPQAELDVDGEIIAGVRVRSGVGTSQPLRLEANGALLLTADRNNDEANQRINFYINGEADANMKMTILENGNVGIGTTNPQSTLQVEGSPGYLQIDSNNGIPPASDCDSNAERGRMILDFANNRLYVCTGAGGWKYTVLQ